MHFPFSSISIVATSVLFFLKDALAVPAEARTATEDLTARPSIAPALVDSLRMENPRMEPRFPQGDVTPDNQPIQPISGLPGQGRQQQIGLTCDGRAPSWAYPGLWNRGDFLTNQRLCANEQNGGNREGNMGGYCNDNVDPPVVAFLQTDANFDLYNDDSFMVHCFVWCYCNGHRNRGSSPNGLIPYGPNLFINISNYGYALIYGPSGSPTSTRTVLATGLARLSVQRSLDFSPGTLGGGSASSSSTSTTTVRSGPSSSPGAGAAQPINPPNPQPLPGECNSECSSNVMCNLDDTAGTSKPDKTSCGVCELGPPTPFKDAVFPPGRCAQAIAASLLMSMSLLLPRDISSTSNFSTRTLNGSVLPPLPQYNLTQPTACACNISFVHLICCGYHNGSLPASVGPSLGTVDVASA